MSITGLFLILFLLVHLTVNLTLLGGAELFNEASEFMETNPLMKVLEPILAIGFLIHIIYSIILTIQNMMSRPVKYSEIDRWKTTTWSSRNMFILGVVIFCFLIVHLMNYTIKIKFDLTDMDDYTLVTTVFSQWYYVLIYVVGIVFLGLHLNHALQSAFHTLGLNNLNWMCRLKIAGSVYAILITVGFTTIALYFYIVSNL